MHKKHDTITYEEEITALLMEFTGTFWLHIRICLEYKSLVIASPNAGLVLLYKKRATSSPK
jgi:hypothetical protein